MNYATLAGNLGADPETRFTSSGLKVTTLRLATRSRKGETVWWKVTIWGEQFEKMMPYLKKGSSLMVMGEISKPEIYNDREGKQQISMEITASHIAFSPFGKGKGDGESSSQQKTANSFGSSGSGTFSEPEVAHSAFAGEGKNEFSDDEIPF